MVFIDDSDCFSSTKKIALCRPQRLLCIGDNDCSSTTNCISREVTKLGIEYAEKWRTTLAAPEFSKAAFYEQAATLYGPDLVKFMDSKIQATTTDELAVELIGTGHFMDIDD